jgi:arginine decarboxylase
MSVDRQTDMPLQAAVERLLSNPGIPFTTPGHKRAPWLVDPLLARDVPHAGGADDMQLSQNVLGRAERLAAELWGGDYCRFAVNGSTQGNEALALSIGQPGDRVAVSRTVHKSVLAGLLLADLVPEWIYPEIDPTTGLSAGVPQDEVRRVLDLDVRAVLLVEPAYTGVLSDVQAIATLRVLQRPDTADDSRRHRALRSASAAAAPERQVPASAHPPNCRVVTDWRRTVIAIEERVSTA